MYDAAAEKRREIEKYQYFETKKKIKLKISIFSKNFMIVEY